MLDSNKLHLKLPLCYEIREFELLQIESELNSVQKQSDWSREAISTGTRRVQSVSDANDLLALNMDELKRELKENGNDIKAMR